MKETKSIRLNAIIDTISSKKDRSLGLRISTPELTTDERSLFFELQGMNIDLSITPLDTEEEPEEQKIDTDLKQKSQSQRIRSVLFLLWKQNPENMEFEQFYHNKTEKYIEHLKSKLDD